MELPLKVTYTFNKLYGNFLRDIKGVNDEIKKKVKANYKVIVKNSPEYMAFFWGNLSKHESNIDPSNAELLNEQVFKDITLNDLLSSASGESNTTMIWNYIYILSALSMINVEVPAADDAIGGEINIEDEVPELVCEVDGNGSEEVFSKVIKIFGNAMKGEDSTSDLADIVDDDLKSVLSKLKKPSTQGTADGGDEFMNMFASIENSKICNIAKEISQEIDVSSLKLESPQDIMKLMDFSSGNNVLGNIIGKVGSKIQEKITTGEIKHEDLLGEAMNMMGMMQKSGAAANLFNNPMMSELMKGMKKGKVAPKSDVFKRESTRDRLRKKLDERQQRKE